MSALPLPSPVTIEEFDRLDLPQDGEYELFEGEIAEVSHPDYVHCMLEKRIVALLEASAKSGGVASAELSYDIRTTPRQTRRRSDVGYLRFERHQAALKNKRVQGAPDMVVEIVSPSNGYSYLNNLERLCLANGCSEFWIVDPENRSVRTRKAGEQISRVYEISDTIPQNSLGIGPVSISDIFEGIPEAEPSL